MATDKEFKLDDYSWFKVHWRSFKQESKVLLHGIVKNFRRVTWHSGKKLIIEYLQVVFVLVFLTLFCYLVYNLVLIL